MSGLAMVIVGLVLGAAGAWSIRTVLVAGGFGAGWLLASVFGANFLTALIIALSTALLAWIVLRVAATLVFFVVGALVGAIVGGRLYRILEGGEGNILLAVVFVPAVALAAGWLAEKARERFVAWGTAIGGAALVLSGLGVLVAGLAWLRDPTEQWQAVLGGVTWVALAVGFRLIQKAIGTGDFSDFRLRPGGEQTVPSSQDD
ncbi:DUF4203 domain-containing protein [Janibacter cremeus]|uniref:Uncharacterized membrane protein (DUF485 family) n=1 Tax=Janibacter cremeus TaxID=1285192 RepID=A0A852VVJ6_9MICO|nr:DUF4203 domain-containing protein [Janibacter cremeus]NYF98314.1 uncharacterized membrane protein (DUF485 family) [Janibacter cremeus]